MQSFQTSYGDISTVEPDYTLGGGVFSNASYGDFPILSMEPQTASQTGWDSIRNIMGAVGSVGQTARDIGTAVGTIERDIKGASQEYQTARNNAKSGNKLGQWWDYAPTTDKVMVGLAAAGLVLVVVQMVRGK